MLWQLIAQLADIVVLFLVAWLISFVLEPAVATVSRFPWLSRTVAVLLVSLTLLATLLAGMVILLPAFAAQSVLAAEQLPTLASQIEVWVRGTAALLAARGLAVPDYSEQLFRSMESVGPALVTNALSIATWTGAAVVQILLTMIVSLYLMLDGPRLANSLIGVVPLRYRDDVAYFMNSTDRAFGGFLRGQIIQSVVYGAGVAVIMLAAGLPFVALGSVGAGIAIFIPFFGPLLGVIPPVAIGLTTDVGRGLIVLGLTVVLSFVVINVVAPKVMSQQIGLHPIAVLAAVLIGVRIAGPWGAVFGVPLAAILATMISFYHLTVAERKQRVLDVAKPAGAKANGGEARVSEAATSRGRR
ncbi:MAG: AI-2E family transporter [Chloroflexi bacterium]|nr:AI-2E family transporter [Chloroflexota bacterium]